MAHSIIKHTDPWASELRQSQQARWLNSSAGNSCNNDGSARTENQHSQAYNAASNAREDVLAQVLQQKNHNALVLDHNDLALKAHRPSSTLGSASELHTHTSSRTQQAQDVAYVLSNNNAAVSPQPSAPLASSTYTTPSSRLPSSTGTTPSNAAHKADELSNASSAFPSSHRYTRARRLDYGSSPPSAASAPHKHAHTSSASPALMQFSTSDAVQPATSAAPAELSKAVASHAGTQLPQPPGELYQPRTAQPSASSEQLRGNVCEIADAGSGDSRSDLHDPNRSISMRDESSNAEASATTCSYDGKHGTSAPDGNTGSCSSNQTQVAPASTADEDNSSSTAWTQHAPKPQRFTFHQDDRELVKNLLLICSLDICVPRVLHNTGGMGFAEAKDFLANDAQKLKRALGFEHSIFTQGTTHRTPKTTQELDLPWCLSCSLVSISLEEDRSSSQSGSSGCSILTSCFGGHLQAGKNGRCSENALQQAGQCMPDSASGRQTILFRVHSSDAPPEEQQIGLHSGERAEFNMGESTKVVQLSIVTRGPRGQMLSGIVTVDKTSLCDGTDDRLVHLVGACVSLNLKIVFGTKGSEM